MDLEQNAAAAPATPKKKCAKTDSSIEESPKKIEKKSDGKSDSEDPKPRIILTFRSEKPGAKSSAMKIVPTEEIQEGAKHGKRGDTTPMTHKKQGSKLVPDESLGEKTSLRRSNRLNAPDRRQVQWIPSEEHNGGGYYTYLDDSSESESKDTPQNFPSRRRREKDNIMANAIARKEQMYNETVATSRPSRRIKPTAKVLENEELRLKSQARQAQDRSPVEGVRTRRSVRSSHHSTHDDSSQNESSKDDSEGQNQVMKLKHLCELGLKAKSPGSSQNNNSKRNKNDDDETEPIEIYDLEDDEDEEEVDDDTEVISKLLEDDSDSCDSDNSEIPVKRVSSYNYDSDFSIEVHRSRVSRRRSKRKMRKIEDSDEISGDEELEPPRPKHRAKRSDYESHQDVEDVELVADGDAGAEAACPSDAPPIAACYCETPSNVYAAPDLLPEPVFCQAIATVEGVRVGCCNRARREHGSYGALLRSGPRAPYILLCKQHAQELVKHMCCPACGLFCEQGTFYQCSVGHLFHVECCVPYGEARARAGCPHCGVRAPRWAPANTDCRQVVITQRQDGKTVFLPEQRDQATPAYLGFPTPKPPPESGPVIPVDLLPCPPIDLKKMCQVPAEVAEDLDSSPMERLYDAIMAGETVDQLVPKIMVSDININAPLASAGCTLLHAAARRGNLPAVYALHCAGAQLDALDSASRTPLIVAVTAMLEKPEDKLTKKSKRKKESTEENTEESKEKDETDKEEKEEDIKMEDDKEVDIKMEDDKEVTEKEKPSDEDFMKVIRYLIAAGCDVNLPGPEGLTALHIAAEYGDEAVANALLEGGASVDPRDTGGWTPLVWGAEGDHRCLVRLLIRSGADPMSSDAEGNQAVHWCALSGAAHALTELLSAAPQAAHALNTHADTPLHIAARQGHYSCVVILLARGARTDVENSGGALPVEVCSGDCQTAISLNMQMSLVRQETATATRVRLLSSDISRGREEFPIPCVNEVDDTPLPEEFTYVAAHVMPKHIAIDNSIENLQGCSCKEANCSDSACSCCVLGVRAWYTRGAGGAARLPPRFPYHDPPMLFECNVTCDCDYKKCGNNAITRLSKRGSVFVRAEVFRAGGARGWGLRATAAVPRGSPVALYVGELITLDEADQRAADQYMFALDVKPDLLEQCSSKEVICVDAARWGGGARFINHSCRPNTAPVRVFTGTRDLRMPHVALFARTDISPGEEITFDYGDKFWCVKSKWMRCECGAPDCRYSSVSTEDNKS